MRSCQAFLGTFSVFADPGDISMCAQPDGTTKPCGPGNQVCPPGSFGANAPQFHIRDDSCAVNDPNGPSYDPIHGVYHVHYQNHVGLPTPGHPEYGGRTYGHVVSRDLVHWAKMPISIWNDQDYDNFAIYSGSATIVDGQTVQMYPGLCNTSLPGCPGPINMCIATPADPTDPLQTNWSKSFTGTGVHNPVLPNANRDPSTAWRTAAGEWRFTDAYSEIYGSLDFKEWYRIGAQKHFPGGDCVSFFALPATTPGAGPAPAGAKTYTHVHKASHGCSAERPCQDCMQVCASSTAFCFTNYVRWGTTSRTASGSSATGLQSQRSSSTGGRVSTPAKVVPARLGCQK